MEERPYPGIPLRTADGRMHQEKYLEELERSKNNSILLAGKLLEVKAVTAYATLVSAPHACGRAFGPVEFDHGPLDKGSISLSHL